MDGVLDVWDIYTRQNAVTYSYKVSESALSSIAVQGTAQSGGGRLAAVGDVNGTVALLEVSSNLAVPPPTEKVRSSVAPQAAGRRMREHPELPVHHAACASNHSSLTHNCSSSRAQAIISGLFERESKREENLEKRAIALARAARAAAGKGGAGGVDGEASTASASTAGAGAAALSDDAELMRKVDSSFLAAIREAEEADGKEHRGEEASASKSPPPPEAGAGSH